MTARTGRTEAAAGASLLALAMARLVVDTWQVLRAPIGPLTSRIHDDGWYYLVIARNLADGTGPSFAGGEATNGYQPFWQGVLAAAGIGLHGTALARASLLLGSMATVAAFALVLRTVHRIRPLSLLGMGVVVAIATSPPVWNRLVDGMEGPAVVLAAALVVAAADRWWRRPAAATAALVGAACGLLVLGRLSGAAVIWLVPLGLGLAHRPARAGRHLVAWAALLLVVVAPWAVWSRAEVGSWRPVTLGVKGAIEQQATGPQWSVDRGEAFAKAMAEEASTQVDAVVPFGPHLPRPVHRLVVVAVVPAAALLGLLAVRRRRALLVVVVPLAAVAGRVLVDLALLPSRVPEWYGSVLVLPTVVVSLAAVEAARSAVHRATSASPARGRRGPARLGVAGLVVLVAGGATLATAPDGRGTGSWEQANREAALALPRFGSPARAGAFDAGVVGWFAPGARNLDGLVRGPAYVAALDDGQPTAGQVLDEPIDLLVNRTGPGDRRVPSCARARWRSPTTVRLGTGPAVPVTIWDLRPCRRRG